MPRSRLFATLATVLAFAASGCKNSDGDAQLEKRLAELEAGRGTQELTANRLLSMQIKSPGRMCVLRVKILRKMMWPSTQANYYILLISVLLLRLELEK